MNFTIFEGFDFSTVSADQMMVVMGMTPYYGQTLITQFVTKESISKFDRDQ
jgi:hypothetical protein